MKKSISTVITLAFSVFIAFASMTSETGASAGIETKESVNEGMEIVSTEYLLRVNHIYRFFQGTDDSQKSVTTEHPIKDGDTVTAGGLSDLMIAIGSIQDDTLSFTTNYNFVIYGTEYHNTAYTIKVGEELDLIDYGICDAASEYLISLIKIDRYDTESFRTFSCDLDGDKEADQISFDFIDNGDEAPSLNILQLVSKGTSYEGYVDQAYDLLSLTAVTDTAGTHLEAEFTTGDFYSHDSSYVYTITFDGETILVEY